MKIQLRDVGATHWQSHEDEEAFLIKTATMARFV
jgi:hypothetical protein